MFPHHAATIENAKEHFRRQPEVLALLLGGSIAHGFALSDSDVDILIVLSDDAYAERVQTGKLTFNEPSLATYPGGYVDGKYISLPFIRKVAEKGSEPARFAFDGCQILYSHLDGLDEEIQKAAAYPVDQQADRIAHFAGQLPAWRWFTSEARRQGNPYLMSVAVNKLILFGGRLILAHNELLYPFHKWFLAVLEKAPSKPDGLMDALQKLQKDPSTDNVEAFYNLVKDYREWDPAMNWVRWGARFMADVELTWMDDRTALDDL